MVDIRNTICLGSRVRLVSGEEKKLLLITRRDGLKGQTVRSFATGEGDYVIGLVVNDSAPESVVDYNIDRALLQRAARSVKKNPIVPGDFNLEVNKLVLESQGAPSFWLWSDGSQAIACFVSAVVDAAGVALNDGSRGIELARIETGGPAVRPLPLDAKELKKLAAPLIAEGADVKQLMIRVV